MVMLWRKAPVSREVQGMGGVRPAFVAAVDADGDAGAGTTGDGDGPPCPRKGTPAGNRLGSSAPGSERRVVGESIATPASRPSTSKLNRSTESQLGIRLGDSKEEAGRDVDCSAWPGGGVMCVGA